jgi:hypothetical protein
MTKLQTTNPHLWERETTPSEYRFACDLASVPISEFEHWEVEGYGNAAATLMLLQEFNALTDAQMVRTANLCDYEGLSIGDAVAEVSGCC